MRRLLAKLSIGTLMIGASAALPCWGQSVKDDVKDAGHATKTAAKETGHATKTAAKETGHAAEKTGSKVKKTTKKTVHHAAGAVEKKTE